MQIAQSFGVRVHLLGIEPSRGSQSLALLQEADTTTEWSKADMNLLLAPRPGYDINALISGGSGSHEADSDVADALQEAIVDFASSLDPLALTFYQ